MIRNASELSPAENEAVEMLPGRHVQDGEAVSVRAFERATLTEQQRREIAKELRRYFAEVDESRTTQTEAELDEAITEAMRSVRPSYRSHR